MTTKSELGRIGVWSASVRFSPRGAEAAAELERLGFQTVWVPGGVDNAVLQSIDALLDATTNLRVASGILNIWKFEPAEVAAWLRGQSPERKERVLLGLGVSHAPLIGEAWAKPLTKMQAFLDGLDAEGAPRARLCLAALGPKMLELAAARTTGAHPYLVTPRHTAEARRIMGPEALLAPEQGVILETDPAKAREIARKFMRHYVGLPNYANTWRRDGFSEQEIETVSDRLIDALFAWGDLDAIQQRIDAHHAAGADHVCVQAIGAAGLKGDMDEDISAWRRLATLL